MVDRPDLGFRPYLDGYFDASLQLQLHVYRRSEALFDHWERHKDALDSPERLREWQAHVRACALASIGGLPPADTPLEPELVGTAVGYGFEVDRLIFQSLPRVYVTANLYRPRRLIGPTGAVLFLCGHSEQAKIYPPYQAVCQRLAKNGLIVLAVDPLGQGERKSYLDAAGRELVRWGTGEHSYAGLQCWWLGHSIARYFVHDARRAIDYLAGLPEVDPARIGVTGNSGGGTQTAWTMLLEPRLAAAAPATFIMRRREYLWTGQAQDAEQIIPGGTAAGLDHEDYLIAMAPRPALVLSVDYDFFNLEGTVATVERARRAFRVLGHEEHLRFVHTPSTHEYHPVLARAATEFFVEHLLGQDPKTVDHSDPRPLDPAALQCTRSGQVLLDRPDTRRVFDLNLQEYRAIRESQAPQTPTPETARDWLSDVIHRHRRPGAPYARWLPAPALAGARVARGLWWSERDVLGAGVLARPEGEAFRSLVVATFEDGTREVERRRGWLETRLAEGQAVLVLDVRGTGALSPHPINERGLADDYGTLFKLECDLLWLDDSLEAMRVYDVLRAIRLAREDTEIDLRDRPVRLYGAGLGATHAYLAAVLDPRVEAIELENPPVDVAGTLEARLYRRDPDWQALLPGLGARLRLEDFEPLLHGRLDLPADPTGREPRPTP